MLIRIAPTLLCIAVSGCQNIQQPYAFWKGDLVPPESRKILSKDAIGTVTRITRKTNGQVGRTVWEITFQARGPKTPEPLLTVERVLDEKLPGKPFVEGSGVNALIHDRSRSFIYSLGERRFVLNPTTDAVYPGSYQNYMRLSAWH